nr:hypothetical transcript [Hymenolepis microstoma]
MHYCTLQNVRANDLIVLGLCTPKIHLCITGGKKNWGIVQELSEVTGKFVKCEMKGFLTMQALLVGGRLRGLCTTTALATHATSSTAAPSYLSVCT